jgi:hypothetical protein
LKVLEMEEQNMPQVRRPKKKSTEGKNKPHPKTVSRGKGIDKTKPEPEIKRTKSASFDDEINLQEKLQNLKKSKPRKQEKKKPSSKTDTAHEKRKNAAKSGKRTRKNSAKSGQGNEFPAPKNNKISSGHSAALETAPKKKDIAPGPKEQVGKPLPTPTSSKELLEKPVKTDLPPRDQKEHKIEKDVQKQQLPQESSTHAKQAHPQNHDAK